jgi:hypothetical protein
MKHKPTLPVRVGVFDSLAAADLAVQRLIDAGFERDHITVICPTCSVDQYRDVDREPPAGARTPVAAASGGAIGAVLGGLVALAGVTATGGMGLLAAGPLLLGAGGGGVAGGLIGAMMTRGVEKEVADFYDQALERGQILVAVEEESENAPERLALAETIIGSAGADPLALREG